jgi:surface antigen
MEDMARRVLLAVVLVILGGGAGCDKSQYTSIVDPIVQEVSQRAGSKVARTTGVQSFGQVVQNTGFLISGEIARRLDERDRRLASEATQKVLNAPSETLQSSKTTESWKSDHNPNVSGRATVTASTKTTDGRVCKAVNEVAYIGGKEVVQNVQYCRGSDESGWTRVV